VKILHSNFPAVVRCDDFEKAGGPSDFLAEGPKFYSYASQ